MFTAGGIAVVALAVTLALVLAGQGGRQGAVTQSTVPAAEQVSGATAVADLMPLYRLKSSNDLTPAGNDASAQMEQAVAQGLVTREQASGAWASGPMTQGAYAVLLVKAFASFLPQGGFPEQQMDPLATLAERQAIAALMSSEVILSQDGRFVAGQTLTKDVESRLLGRVRNIFERVIGE